MKVIEIAFTGYPVTDVKRARQFYEETLGLKPTKVFGDDKMAWVEYDIGPHTLAIGNGAPDWKPSPGGGSVGLEVDDFDAAVTHLKQSGAPFRLEPIGTPVCRMAVVSDPDGNSITIHRRRA
jgi:catechol 2,3-dioxygenase-like lactoylglutathione lyase family enzyme